MASNPSPRRGVYRKVYGVIACQEERDARELLEALDERLRSHKLTLNRDKTQLYRFGRHGQKKGPGKKSETFDFLGLTPIAGKDRQGRYLVIRKTAKKRFGRGLKAIGQWCKENMHKPVAWQWSQLSRKLVGHYNYYGVRGNSKALGRFRHGVWQRWFKSLKRRSQKTDPYRIYSLLREVFKLPNPRITHPQNWLSVNPGYLLGRAGCDNAACPNL